MDTPFAKWFRGIRRKRKLTQDEAAAQLQISGPTVCRWEQGAEPLSRYLKRVSVWGKISPAKLLDLVAG